MSWVKRNLPFLMIGGVAVALLGFAGYYCFSKWRLNQQKLEELNSAYADWERITRMNPNPGSDKVNNIQLAREQEARVRATIDKLEKYFAPIPPIPNPQGGSVTKEEFASALRRTVDQLQRSAANSSVTLPPRYGFSFEAQRPLYTFAPGSLQPLSERLGHIKAICDVLFAAKINSLDGIRRERVSNDDLGGPQADYLDPAEVSVTNELAVLVPYEVTFQCFSAELARVLAGFGSQPHGFIIKSINVQSGAAATAQPAAGGLTGYGVGPEAERPVGPYPGAPGYPYPAPTPYGVPPGGVAPTVQTSRGGLPTVLDEKQMKVTMTIVVVQLLPKQS